MSDNSSSDHTSSSRSSESGLSRLGWNGLAAGVLAVVLYGLSLSTPWTWTDPLGLEAKTPMAADPARFQRVLADALDQVWTQLGGHEGGVVFSELTDDPRRLERAGQLIDGVLASAPENARAYMLQGLWHVASGRQDAAIQSVQRSLELDGGHQSLLVLGTLHAHFGHPDRAEPVFRRAVEEYPHSISAWNNLGQTLWQLGRQDESKAAYRRKLELEQPEPTSAGTPETTDGDR